MKSEPWIIIMNNVPNTIEEFNVQWRQRKLCLISGFVKQEHKNKKNNNKKNTHRTNKGYKVNKKPNNMRAAGLSLSDKVT